MNYMFINALCLKLLLTCKCVYITENFLVSWLYALLLYFLLFLTFYLIEEGKIKKPEAANISFAQPFNFLSMFVYCHLYFICNLWIYWTAIIFRNIKVFFNLIDFGIRNFIDHCLTIQTLLDIQMYENAIEIQFCAIWYRLIYISPWYCTNDNYQSLGKHYGH